MTASPIWIGTSWKMTKTLAEAREYVACLAEAVLPDRVQVFVLPPHTALAAVRERLPATSPILLGAQNAHWATEGAGTGEISMRMAADAGARVVELGHSERRAAFGESDETVARKVRAALDHDLIPLVCIGEPADVRAAGEQVPFVTAQLRAATRLIAADELPRLLVAYEPVWAIGDRGRPAVPEEVAPVMAALGAALASASPTGASRGLLYGGGVDADNAAGLLAGTAVDGLFVGRAAWTVEGLLALVAIGDAHARRSGSSRLGGGTSAPRSV